MVEAKFRLHISSTATPSSRTEAGHSPRPIRTMRGYGMRRLTGLTYRSPSPIMVASHDADRQIIGWWRTTSFPAFEIAQMPVDLSQQFLALKPRIDVHDAGIPNLRELLFDSKKSPGFLKGRGLSLTTVRHLKSPVSPSPQPCNAVRFRGIRSARFRFTVPNFPIAQSAR